jgi:hypothetical protein
MSAWLYDVRQAIAASWRRPLFTALLVAVLSMGIGAAVAMFSVLKLNAVVLRPLPYGDPQRLMWLWSIRADGTRTAFAFAGVRTAARQRELAVRAALVLRTDFACVVLGIGAGLIIARLAPSAIRGMLFDVGAAEPGPYAVVAMLLAAVAAAACYVPATHAARIDPVRILRD